MNSASQPIESNGWVGVWFARLVFPVALFGSVGLSIAVFNGGGPVVLAAPLPYREGPADQGTGRSNGLGVLRDSTY